MPEPQAKYDTNAKSTAVEQEKLTGLERAIVETHKPISDEEVRWYIKIASKCECKPSKGVSIGVCRSINSICDFGKCPFRLHWGSLAGWRVTR